MLKKKKEEKDDISTLLNPEPVSSLLLRKVPQLVAPQTATTPFLCYYFYPLPIPTLYFSWNIRF